MRVEGSFDPFDPFDMSDLVLREPTRPPHHHPCARRCRGTDELGYLACGALDQVFVGQVEGSFVPGPSDERAHGGTAGRSRTRPLHRPPCSCGERPLGGAGDEEPARALRDGQCVGRIDERDGRDRRVPDRSKLASSVAGEAVQQFRSRRGGDGKDDRARSELAVSEPQPVTGVSIGGDRCDGRTRGHLRVPETGGERVDQTAHPSSRSEEWRGAETPGPGRT